MIRAYLLVALVLVLEVLYSFLQTLLFHPHAGSRVETVDPGFRDSFTAVPVSARHCRALSQLGGKDDDETTATRKIVRLHPINRSHRHRMYVFGFDFLFLPVFDSEKIFHPDPTASSISSPWLRQRAELLHILVTSSRTAAGGGAPSMLTLSNNSYCIVRSVQRATWKSSTKQLSK